MIRTGRTYLCGDGRFTLADIRLYVYYTFISKVDKRQRASPELTQFTAYIQRIAERPSALMIKPPKKHT